MSRRGSRGHRGTRPIDALTPTRPQNDAGRRIEPPPSLAIAIGQIRAATAAAEPALEPPEVRAGFHGLRVVGKRGIVAEAAIAEFRGVGFTNNDRVGGLQPLDDDVVMIGNEVGVELGPEGGADAFGQY